MNELEIRKISEQYVGMRCKVDKNGDIILYANAWTLIVDLIKKLKNKIK